MCEIMKPEILNGKFRSIVGEGPLWDADNNLLMYIDILGECFYTVDFSNNNITKTDVGQQIGCMALCENGDLLLALQDGIYRMTKNGEKKLAHAPLKIKGRRFNDGKVGPDGCFYVGTTDSNNQGAFYRLKDGVLTEVFEGCGCSNGLDWSADETKMFYCDTVLQKIEIFDFDKQTGTLSNRRTFAEIDEKLGKPDGFTMDAEDNIWLGLWDGGAVLEIKKDGTFGTKISVAAKKASCCCFAGKDLNRLIITTASKDDSEAYPLSGYTFITDVNAIGKAPYKYKY